MKFPNTIALALAGLAAAAPVDVTLEQSEKIAALESDIESLLSKAQSEAVSRKSISLRRITDMESSCSQPATNAAAVGAHATPVVPLGQNIVELAATPSSAFPEVSYSLLCHVMSDYAFPEALDGCKSNVGIEKAQSKLPRQY